MAGSIEDSIRFVERLIENPNTDLNSIKIELGDKNDRAERRMKGNQVIFRVPKSYYETLRIKLDGEKAVKKLRSGVARKEHGEYIDQGNRDINNIFRGHVRDEAIDYYTSTPKKRTIRNTPKGKPKNIKKKNIRNKVKRKTNKRYKSKNNSKIRNLFKNIHRKVKRFKEKYGRRIKALIASIILAGGVYIAGKNIGQNINEYSVTEKMVEGLSVDEINKLAEDELLQAISEDTSVSIDNIKIAKTNIGSSEEKTEVTFTEGEEKTTYSLSVNNRDPINLGSMSGNINRVISSIKNARTKEDAVKALMQERKFVRNNIVKSQDGKLTTETRTTETKSEGTQDMDEYTL